MFRGISTDKIPVYTDADQAWRRGDGVIMGRIGRGGGGVKRREGEGEVKDKCKIGRGQGEGELLGISSSFR